jgi:hypothetical protein
MPGLSGPAAFKEQRIRSMTSIPQAAALRAVGALTSDQGWAELVPALLEPGGPPDHVTWKSNLWVRIGSARRQIGARIEPAVLDRNGTDMKEAFRPNVIRRRASK